MDYCNGQMLYVTVLSMPGINAILSQETHDALKKASAETGIKLRFILTQAIEEWVKKHLPSKAKRAA